MPSPWEVANLLVVPADRDLPMIAAEWLASGYDSAALRELAAVSSANFGDAGSLLPHVLASLGHPMRERESPWDHAPWRGYWSQIEWAQRGVDRLLKPYAAAQHVLEVIGDVQDLWVPGRGDELMSLLAEWDGDPGARADVEDRLRRVLTGLSAADVPPLVVEPSADSYLRSCAFYDPSTALAAELRLRYGNSFEGKWEERDWRNASGMFYGAMTDNCGTGRQAAPDNVLYEDARWGEVVWRQPRTAGEVAAIVEAAWNDPFAGYGADGLERWTPELVLAWWADRDRLRAWAWEQMTNPEWNRLDSGGSQVFYDLVAYIDNGLEEYVRTFVEFLELRRIARQT